MNIDQFDSYLTGIDFKFFKHTISTLYGNGVLYARMQNDSSLKADYSIIKYLHPRPVAEKNVISFQTVYVSDYLNYKKDLEKEGYIETGTNNNDLNGLTISFKKQGYTAKLSFYLATGEKKKQIYEITVIEN